MDSISYDRNISGHKLVSLTTLLEVIERFCIKSNVQASRLLINPKWKSSEGAPVALYCQSYRPGSKILWVWVETMT